MKLNPSDTKKLLAVLKRLGIRPALVQDYISGLQPGTGQSFKTTEREIALTLIKKKPKQFGWAIPKTGPGSILVEAKTGVILTSPDNKPVWRQQPVTIPPQAIVSKPLLAGEILGSEGRASHMYADFLGKPTIGVGHLIENLGEAQNLPFVYKTSGNSASVADIATEFTLIAAFGQHNFPASHFDPLTDLELSDPDIDQILEADLTQHMGIANSFFALTKLPQWVQIGLIDLAFQVGETGLTPL